MWKSVKDFLCSTGLYFLSGQLDDWIEQCHSDLTLVKTLLRKLGFSREHFDIPLEKLSQGQKRKSCWLFH